MENSRRRKIALTEINAGKESRGKSQEPKGFPPTNDVGTTLQDLPSQLIMEIFSSLPMKTIFACRCVCKLWQRLILDPDFIDLHLSKASSISLLLRTIQKRRKPKMLHLFDLRDDKTDCRESRIKLKKKALISLTLSFVL